jgi:hypothetical protein
MHLYFSYQSGANGGVIVVKKKTQRPWGQKNYYPCKEDLHALIIYQYYVIGMEYSIWSVQLPSVTIREPFPSSHQISLLHIYSIMSSMFSVLGSRLLCIVYWVHNTNHVMQSARRNQ